MIDMKDSDDKTIDYAGRNSAKYFKEKLWAAAKSAKIINGKTILDRNDASGREWFDADKSGTIFKNNLYQSTVDLVSAA